ncbi:MAG: PEGA domain-containing protein [Wujia sp.]
MRKKLLIAIIFFIILSIGGCGDTGSVKVYDNTEETDISHTELSMTAVITNINTEDGTVSFIDCRTSESHSLIYHGGVAVTNTRGNAVSLSELGMGCVVDVVYYQDTSKLVSIAANGNTRIVKDTNKFTADKENGKAVYKGISCSMWEDVVVVDDGKLLDVSEVSTEDKVTLYIYGNKLVSVVITSGHGYVRLSNQDSYIGGMVELGYDVIVPVTSDMLVPVGEGEYTLRINKNGYSQTKKIKVIKDSETLVDLSDIAVPKGTVVFEVTPMDAKIYVDGELISGKTYTDFLGSYGLKIEAEGYQTFQGSFKVTEKVKNFTIELQNIDGEDDDDTTETTEDTTESTDSTSESTDTSTDTTTETEQSTENTTVSDSGITTDNTVTVAAPVGVSVYVDGDYVGISPISFSKVTGIHTITLYKSGYLIKSYTINETDDGEDKVYSYPSLTTLLDIVE